MSADVIALPCPTEVEAWPFGPVATGRPDVDAALRRAWHEGHEHGRARPRDAALPCPYDDRAGGLERACSWSWAVGRKAGLGIPDDAGPHSWELSRALEDLGALPVSPAPAAPPSGDAA